MAKSLFSIRNISLGCIVCLTLLPSLAAEHVQVLDYRLNEQVIHIPAGKNGHIRLQTTVFRPDGPGPFPLVIINHGKDAGAPSSQPRDRFIYMATAFVKRGYAVMVPMRRGFAGSSGHYVEYGCNMTANGLGQASDVRDAIDYAQHLSWIDNDRIVVIGQSYGGLATMALGTLDVPGVRGLINFAGGLRDTANRCDWRGSLVKALGSYAASTTLPSLWMYGENDSLFDPALVSRMHDAYVGAGGNARLVEYGAFRRDAHGMIGSRDGEKVWWDEAEKFLKRIGMPTEQLYAVAAAPSMPKSDYARLDDVDAVPFLHEAGRLAYREYLEKLSPRAFAVAPNGTWCWAEDGEEPDLRALATCEKKGGQPCRLYSIDSNVVWTEDTPRQQLIPTLADAAGVDITSKRANAAVGGSASNSK